MGLPMVYLSEPISLQILWRRPQINARHRYNLRYNSSKDRFEANYPGMDSAEEELEEEEAPSMYYDEDAEEDLSNEVGDPGPRGLGKSWLWRIITDVEAVPVVP